MPKNERNKKKLLCECLISLQYNKIFTLSVGSKRGAASLLLLPICSPGPDLAILTPAPHQLFSQSGERNETFRKESKM